MQTSLGPASVGDDAASPFSRASTPPPTPLAREESTSPAGGAPTPSTIRDTLADLRRPGTLRRAGPLLPLPTPSSRRRSPAVPAVPALPRAIAGAASPPPAPTEERLRAWGESPASSRAERADRRHLVNAILDAWAASRAGEPCTLSVSHLPALRSLPSHLTVVGQVTIRHCPNLRSLPPDLIVGETLTLQHCPRLRDIPAGLHVGGDLVVQDCEALERVNGPLQVGRDIELSECQRLAELPSRLEVQRDLRLEMLCSLEALPRTLRVGGALDVIDCSALVDAPERLTVMGSFSLSGCDELAWLPESLLVGRHLTLANCPALRGLPSVLHVGGHITVSECEALEGLPDNIASLGLTVDGEVREVDLEESHIQQSVWAPLEGLMLEGMALTLPMAADEWAMPRSAPVSAEALGTLMAEWSELRPAAAASVGAPVVPWPMTGAARKELFDFLNRLRETGEFCQASTRALLAARIDRLLRAMAANDAFAAQCSERIGAALSSCHDRVLLTMNDLDVALHVHQASRSPGPRAALEALGCGLLKLEVVRQHAAAHCQRAKHDEEIEIYLRYETALRESLELPVCTNNMTFERLAKVGPAELVAAEQEARRVAAEPERRADFFAHWQPWQKLLRQEALAAFAWADLPHRAVDGAVFADGVCPITREPVLTCQEPIALGPVERPRLYECADFLEWWREHGMEPAPAPQVPVSLSEAWRPQAAGPAVDKRRRLV